MVLGHGAQDGDVPRAQEGKRVPRAVGEGRVGIVQHKQAVLAHGGGHVLQCVAIEIEAGRVVGIAEEDDCGAQVADRVGRFVDGPAEMLGFACRELVDLRTGSSGGGFVLAEGRGEDGAAPARPEAGAGQQMDELGGAVPDEDVACVDAEAGSEGFAQHQAVAVGVGGQVGLGDSLPDAGRWAEGVDVGAEVQHLFGAQGKGAQLG